MLHNSRRLLWAAAISAVLHILAVIYLATSEPDEVPIRAQHLIDILFIPASAIWALFSLGPPHNVVIILVYLLPSFVLYAVIIWFLMKLFGRRLLLREHSKSV
jgi:hypothetical protein